MIKVSVLVNPRISGLIRILLDWKGGDRSLLLITAKNGIAQDYCQKQVQSYDGSYLPVPSQLSANKSYWDTGTATTKPGLVRFDSGITLSFSAPIILLDSIVSVR